MVVANLVVLLALPVGLSTYKAKLFKAFKLPFSPISSILCYLYKEYSTRSSPHALSSIFEARGEK